MLTSFTDEDVDELERSVLDGKRQIAAVHKDIAAVKRDLKAMIATNVDKWTAFEAKRKVFMDKFERAGHEAHAEYLKSALAQNSESVRYGSVAPELMLLDSKEKCQAVLDAQTMMLQSLDGEIDGLTAKLEGLEGQVNPLKVTLETLQTQVEALRAEEANQQQGSQVITQQANWYGAAAGMLAELNGVEAKEIRGKDTMFQLTVAGQTYQLRVQHSDDRRTQLSGAQLSPPSVQIGDIVSWAVETQVSIMFCFHPN